MSVLYPHDGDWESWKITKLKISSGILVRNPLPLENNKVTQPASNGGPSPAFQRNVHFAGELMMARF